MSVVKRAVAAIRAYPWYVGLVVLVGLELAREHYSDNPVLGDLLKAILEGLLQ